ncbi:ABC transporter permease, partial [Burkholderia cenocepacia]|nr:ABC transporter permease [Burkholderia cenocepacia]
MRVSPRWLPNRFARAYILVFRGSPLLIQMFLVYYGLGQFGVIRESFMWPLLRERQYRANVRLAQQRP